MRTKQSARKSTTGGVSSSIQRDPIKRRLVQLLQTKRKSLTPSKQNQSSDTLDDSLDTQNRTIRSNYSQQSETSNNQSQSMARPSNIPTSQPGGKHIDMNAVRVKPKRRSRITPMLKNIRLLQSGVDLLIPRSAFHRLVRELLQALGKFDFRIQTAALEALQEAAEAYLTRLFEDAYQCTLHAKRVTLKVSDVQLCKRLRRDYERSY